MAKKVSEKDKRFVKKRADYHCEYCAYPEDFANHPFPADHIIPLSKNGSNDLGNLANTCAYCNGQKYDKTHASDP